VKERPILFSAPMVLAILASTKTQTRRVLKPQPPTWATEFGLSAFTPPGMLSARGSHPEHGPSETFVKQRWAQDDRLWVRETWMPDPPIDDTWASTEWNGCGRRAADVPTEFQKPEFCLFAASFEHAEQQRWVPSIHMYRWASRITLEIASVRVERLQSISEDDAKAEGVPAEKIVTAWLGIRPRTISGRAPCSYRESFELLWDGINGKRAGCAWADNPWVWAVSFKRIET
jgi:hypothetical protein